jgi:hypothetical protein
VKLTERHLGPRRKFTGYCDHCGMLYSVYWSHRQTIQHLVVVRMRRREAREARARARRAAA